MTTFGIDYAWSRPSISGLKAAGVKFVFRYLSHDSKKSLSASEATALSRAGINIGVVWEDGSGRAREGFSAGAADARSAVAQARAAGMPDGRPIFFAVDFDAAPSQIYSYFDGIKSVLGLSRTGVYGSYNVVDALRSTRRASFFWQTYAWSAGRLHPATHVYQYSNNHTVAGASCDFDKSLKDDYGQWRVGWTPPPPETRDERKLREWEEELAKIRTYIRKKGDGWHKHPIRWARARKLKHAIAKYKKKLHKD